MIDSYGLEWDLSGIQLSKKYNDLHSLDPLFKEFQKTEKYTRIQSLCLSEYDFTTSEEIYKLTGIYGIVIENGKTNIYGNSDILNIYPLSHYRYYINDLGLKSHFVHYKEINNYDKVISSDLSLSSLLGLVIGGSDYTIRGINHVPCPHKLSNLGSIYNFILVNHLSSESLSFNLELSFISSVNILNDLSHLNLFYLYEILSSTNTTINIIFDTMESYYRCSKDTVILSYLSIFNNLHVYIKHWVKVNEGDAVVRDGKVLFSRGFNNELIYPSNSSLSRSYIKSLLGSTYYQTSKKSHKKALAYQENFLALSNYRIE